MAASTRSRTSGVNVRTPTRERAPGATASGDYAIPRSGRLAVEQFAWGGDYPEVHERYTALDGYRLFTHDVYCTCMAKVRTNIELDDAYVRAIMDRYGVHTKTEAVNLALRHLAGQPMTRDEALAMRGVRAIGGIPEDRPPRGAA